MQSQSLRQLLRRNVYDKPHAWVAEAHCMNDSGGNGKVGHTVIIDANSTTNNVEFTIAIYPSFPNQPTAG